MTEEHVGRRIARAMVTIFIFQLFWKFGGTIVRILAFRQFGGSDQIYIFDAFTFAESTVIWTLYVFFDKFIFPTFLPLFSEERELRGEEAAWKFANTFVNILMLVIAAMAGLCMYFAPQVVNWIAPEWVEKHRDTADLAVRFSRWMLPGLFFLALGSFTYALLNAHKRFAHAAAGAAVHRFGQAAVFVIAFWLFKAPAIWAALAFMLASPAKPITHLFGLKEKLRNYRPSIPYWRPILGPALRWLAEYLVVLLLVFVYLGGWVGNRPGSLATVLVTAVGYFSVRGLISWLIVRAKVEKTLLERLFLLAYPVVVGVVIARLRDIVQDSYATRLEEGGLFGAIKTAKSLGEMPTAVIPIALSMAMFPFLCDMFTRQNLKGLSEVVSRAVKMIVLFFLPLTAVVAILGPAIIQSFAAKDVKPGLVDATALALALYSLGFIFYAAETVLMQTYFSLQNTWVPTLVGAACSFAHIGFIWIAFDVLEGGDSPAKRWLASVGITPFVVVALAFPLSRAVKNVILGGLLHARLRLFHWRDLGVFLPQVLVVTVVTGLVTWGAWMGVAGMKVTMIGKMVRLGAPAAAALIAFVGSLFALRKFGWPVAEFDLIVNWLHEAGWQKVRAKLKGMNK